MYKIRFLVPFGILSTFFFLQFYSPRVKHNIGELQQFNKVINSSQNGVINSSQKEDFREQSSPTETLVNISISKVEQKVDIIRNETTALTKY